MTAEDVAEVAERDPRALEIDPRTRPVRFSALKHMAASPAHYRWACQDQREETLSMRIGSGTHALLFGTPKVVVYRGGDLTVQVEGTGKNKGTFTTKVKTYTDVRNGQLWDEFQAKHAGDCILSETELAKSEAMARAITSDMAADSLLFAPGAQHELDIHWEFRGRACKGRVDALTPTAIPDLKTTKDANPKWFPRQAYQMGWLSQATWYADGAEAAGLGWRHPYLVAVENSAPYPVTVWRLTDAAIVEARRIYRAWFDQLLHCELENIWPGYAGDVLDLDVPGYLQRGDVAAND